jgi:hypothetical protein
VGGLGKGDFKKLKCEAFFVLSGHWVRHQCEFGRVYSKNFLINMQDVAQQTTNRLSVRIVILPSRV